MSRGQLTYYFRAKEDILLAVFDRLLELMHERIGTPGRPSPASRPGWEWVQHLLQTLVGQPPVSPEFHCLQYTFLSQIGHREDFRQRLATLYEDGASNMAARPGGRLDPAARQCAGVAAGPGHAGPGPPARPGHAAGRRPRGLRPPEEMLDLCLDMLGSYLRPDSRARSHESRVRPAAEPAAGDRHPRPKGEPHDRDDQ